MVMVYPLHTKTWYILVIPSHLTEGASIMAHNPISDGVLHPMDIEVRPLRSADCGPGGPRSIVIRSHYAGYDPQIELYCGHHDRQSLANRLSRMRAYGSRTKESRDQGREPIEDGDMQADPSKFMLPDNDGSGNGIEICDLGAIHKPKTVLFIAGHRYRLDEKQDKGPIERKPKPLNVYYVDAWVALPDLDAPPGALMYGRLVRGLSHYDTIEPISTTVIYPSPRQALAARRQQRRETSDLSWWDER